MLFKSKLAKTKVARLWPGWTFWHVREPGFVLVLS